MKGFDLRSALLALLCMSLVAACASAPRTQVVTVAESRDCVVLLHGLNRSWRAMRPMADALQVSGFTTANVD